MSAVVRPPEPVPELDLLWLDSFERKDRGRRERALAGSVALHTAAAVVLLLLPRSAPENKPTHQLRTTATLIAPLTQPAPNRGEIGKEFTLDSLLPQRRLSVPPVPPVSRAPGRPLEMPKPKPRGAEALPEPPRFESTGPLLAQAPQLGAGVPLPQAPPPQIQAAEKPKLAFEKPGVPTAPPRPGGLAPGRIAAPGSSVNEAMRGAIRTGAGGVVVGDLDLPASSGLAGLLGQATAPGSSRSSLELVSDPMGVDFKPYLIQVLAAVRRNWLSIIPESARLGRTGRVQIQFAIARDGYVPKLVIATPSGTDALDRAAVAGVSASVPFQPLPTEFRGQQVRLQFTFLYNMK